MRRSLLALGLAAALALPASAHDGPPFPILVDQPFAGREVSVWADPDVGVGTFYLYLSAEPGDAERLALWVRPSDGRLPEARHGAVPAEPGQPYQYLVEADFDRRGDWDLRFTFEGAGEPSELTSTVDVTPPGTGTGLDVLWFLAPFLAVAFLWGKALQQRRRLVAETAPDPSTSR